MADPRSHSKVKVNLGLKPGSLDLLYAHLPALHSWGHGALWGHMHDYQLTAGENRGSLIGCPGKC